MMMMILVQIIILETAGLNSGHDIDIDVQVHVPGVTIVAADDHIVHPPNGSLLVARSQYIHREKPGCQCSVQRCLPAVYLYQTSSQHQR